MLDWMRRLGKRRGGVVWQKAIPQVWKTLRKPFPDRDKQSGAADWPRVPEPSAGILGHLAVSILRLTRCRFCSVMTVDGPGRN
jgi:hypothetical protein